LWKAIAIFETAEKTTCIMDKTNCILTKEVVQKKLQRMALEIAEQLNGDTDPLVIIGIKGSGMVIAEKVYKLIKPLLSTPTDVICCTLDKRRPEEILLSKEIDFNGLNIIVADDVSNSGRTLLYALKPLLTFYPKRIQTLVLVERMHKAFPIKPDYVGLSVATTLQDHIHVEVMGDEVIGAYLV
jgi:pyrimidine operon attenuation protein/uracil phosphoribosyltransferase